MWKCLVGLLAAGSVAAAGVGGRVVDSNGSPVAGAVVSVVRLDATWRPTDALDPARPAPPTLAQARTSDAGAFRLEDTTAPGLHALAILAPGEASPLLLHRQRLAFGSSPLPDDLEIRLPATCRIRGLALDETGAPAAGTKVDLVAESSDLAMRASTTCDEGGRFELGAPADAVALIAGANGARWGIVRAPLAGGREATLALHLSPLTAIDSTTVDHDSGRPIAGVRTRVLAPAWDPVAPTADEAAHEPWGRALVLQDLASGEDGRLAVRVPESGMAMLAGRRFVANRTLPGQARLIAATPVRGVVVDDRGSPVEGADVRWSELPDASVSDARGRFELDSNIRADVIATTRDGTTRAIRVESITGDVRLLLPAMRRVGGQVVTEAGDPVAGATVRIAADLFDIVTATASDGRFGLDLRSATRVQARRGSFRAEADAGERMRLVLRDAASAPPPSGHVRVIGVRVSDEAGSPLAGALLRATPSGEFEPPDAPPPTAASGTDGQASLRVPGDGKWDIHVLRPGRAAEWIQGLGSTSSTSVRLRPAGMLKGSVRSADGRGVGGAVVVVERQAPATSVQQVGFRPVRAAAMSDAAGSYAIRDLGAGLHAVDVAIARYRSAPRRHVTVAAGGVTTLDIEVDSGATLRGSVRDESGPVAGAVVQAVARVQSFQGDDIGEMTGMRAGYSRADGTFIIEGLEPDRWYDLDVLADWHAPGSGGGRPSESVVEIVLSATGAIVGDVQGDWTDAWVACRAREGDDAQSPRAAHVNVTDGTFSIDPITPGTYTCDVEGSFAVATLERVDVRAGSATAVAVQLEEKPTVVVQVVDARSGLPVEGASVGMDSIVSSTATSDAEGMARLALVPTREEQRRRDAARSEAGLATGEPEVRDAEEEEAHASRVTVMASGFADASAPIPEPPPKVVTVRLDPLPRLRGRVVDASGLAAAGAAVRHDFGEETALSGPDGDFELAVPAADSEIAPEVVTLSASRAQGDRLEEGNVEVDPASSGSVIVTIRPVELASLTVFVRDSDGPVVGARLALLGEGLETRGTTSEEGEFVATRLRPGSVSVVVETDRGSPRLLEVELGPGESIRREVLVDEGWTIEGRVVRAGQPIEGATVAWVPLAGGGLGGSATSRIDGSFRLESVPSEIEEVVLMASSAAAGRRMIHARHRRGEPPITLDVATVILSGRVIRSDAPVAGARVSLRCGGSPAGSAASEPDGTFRITDAPGGSACELKVAEREGVQGIFEVRTVAEGSQEVGDLELEMVVIQGHATFPEGGVVDELVFDLLSRGGARVARSPVPVRPDGTFEVAAGEGVATFVASAPDAGLAWIRGTVDPGAFLELPFRRGAVLEISASEADGTPAQGFVRVVAHDGEPVGTAMGRLVDDGRATLDGLPAGRIAIELDSDGAMARAEVDLLSGQAASVHLTVE